MNQLKAREQILLNILKGDMVVYRGFNNHVEARKQLAQVRELMSNFK